MKPSRTKSKKDKNQYMVPQFNCFNDHIVSRTENVSRIDGYDSYNTETKRASSKITNHGKQ